jgi:4-amino-4-deoxy-L-arabinose transferase-like glycosyltransferase
MSRHLLALLAIVAVGVGIRVTYALTTGHTVGRTSREGQIAHNIVADGRWFERNARADAYVLGLSLRGDRLIDPASVDYASVDRNGRWYPEVAQPVGESAVIAGLWAITGDERYIQIEIVQGVIDGFAALLVYWISMRLFKRVRPALIAAALYAVYPPIAWLAAEPYNDIWAVDFTIAIVAIYLVILGSGRRWRWLIMCGLCAGIGAYFRPNVLLITPVLALLTASVTGWREALRRALTTTVVALLLLVPWTIRNFEDFHAFIPVRSALWQNMWVGLDELPNHFGGNFSERSITAEVHRVRPELVPETPAWDSYIKHYVVRAIEGHPLFYLELLVHRAATATVLVYENAWMHRGAGAVLAHTGGLPAAILHRPLELLEDALEPLVFLLAMLGLGFTWRRWRRQNTILVAVVLCVLVPYIAIHVEGRYLLPAVFAYFVWIGLGAELLIERVERRRRGAGTLAERHSDAPEAVAASVSA